MVNLRVWENFLITISVTLGQGHQATKAGQILSCPHNKVRTAHSIATTLGRYILGMIGSVNVKQKGNESTGCYVD